ncbi:hypothetical protein L208DRAFT_1377177 [Tricholoma matsutake]|nr:hypothetical protein L208DRAFT_1377177 [Tricholoma matsutake 945]
MASLPENELFLHLENILASYSALKDLKTASSDEDFTIVLDKFREMNEKSKMLLTLAGAYDSLHAALLKINSALDMTPAPCTILVVIGTIMTAAGIILCVHVWSFIQYDWADPAIFKASACNLNSKYVSFLLSSHIPAFLVFITSWSGGIRKASEIGDHNAFPMHSFGHVENVGIPHPCNDDLGKENCSKRMEGIVKQYWGGWYF